MKCDRCKCRLEPGIHFWTHTTISSVIRLCSRCHEVTLNMFVSDNELSSDYIRYLDGYLKLVKEQRKQMKGNKCQRNIRRESLSLKQY